MIYWTIAFNLKLKATSSFVPWSCGLSLVDLFKCLPSAVIHKVPVSL